MPSEKTSPEFDPRPIFVAPSTMERRDGIAVAAGDNKESHRIRFEADGTIAKLQKRGTSRLTAS